MILFSQMTPIKILTLINYYYYLQNKKKAIFKVVTYTYHRITNKDFITLYNIRSWNDIASAYHLWLLTLCISLYVACFINCCYFIRERLRFKITFHRYKEPLISIRALSSTTSPFRHLIFFIM